MEALLTGAATFLLESVASLGIDKGIQKLEASLSDKSLLKVDSKIREYLMEHLSDYEYEKIDSFLSQESIYAHEQGSVNTSIMTEQTNTIIEKFFSAHPLLQYERLTLTPLLRQAITSAYQSVFAHLSKDAKTLYFQAAHHRSQSHEEHQKLSGEIQDIKQQLLVLQSTKQLSYSEVNKKTQINKNADLGDVKHQWRKHFGLTRTVLEQVKVLLKSPEEWVYGGKDYYHSFFPEFRVNEVYQYDFEKKDELFKGAHEYYHCLFKNNQYAQGMLAVLHSSTQIYSYPFSILGDYSLLVAYPAIDFCVLKIRDIDFHIRYYCKDEIYYQIFLYYIECYRKEIGNIIDEYASTFLDVILIFETQQEESDFLEYVLKNMEFLTYLVSQEPIPQLLDSIAESAERMQVRIQIARALKKIQKMWYEHNKYKN